MMDKGPALSSRLGDRVARWGAPRVAVIGAGMADPALYQRAREVGRALAARGAIVITGGLGGVMEGACRGALEAGGFTVGILPGVDPDERNPYVCLPIVTGLRDARNVVIARTAQALIAVGGALGTLSEMAFAVKFGRPVVALDSWTTIREVERASTPEEAVEMAMARIGGQSEPDAGPRPQLGGPGSG